MLRTMVKKLIATLLLGSGLAFAQQSPPAAAPVSATLNGTTLLQSIIAELAALRRDFATSASLYLQLAQNTRDPRYAERAVSAARQGRDMKTATEAARLWNTLAPNSQDASRALSELIIMTGGRIEELELAVARNLASDVAQRSQLLEELPAIYAGFTDRAAATTSIFRITEPYLQHPEAHAARAATLISAKRNDEARLAAERALSLRPDYERAALLRMQAGADAGMAKAMAELNEFGKRYPKANAARVAYGRWLLSERRFKEGGEHFTKLLADFPDQHETSLTVGLLAADAGDHATAEKQFRHLIEADFRTDLVYLQLGRVLYASGDLAGAEKAFAEVEASEHYGPARSALAQIQAKRGQLDAARKTLRAAADTDTSRATDYLLAEAQLLRDAKREKDALAVLDEILATDPNNADVLYQSSLLAEQLKNYALMEKRLRRVIELRPDSAMGYNALGYSFADRNINLAEAEKLIARALKLEPDDGAILDSMGWVRFRRGDINSAITYLKRAHAKQKDAEISAHLGEALWVSGQRDEARKIWDAASQATPDNVILRDTVKRLTGKH